MTAPLTQHKGITNTLVVDTTKQIEVGWVQIDTNRLPAPQVLAQMTALLSWNSRAVFLWCLMGASGLNPAVPIEHATDRLLPYASCGWLMCPPRLLTTRGNRGVPDTGSDTVG
jgi:hypothetical protein